MKCFQHQDAEAVGICGGCAKGLCRTCAREGVEGLRCSDACGAVLKASRDLLGKAGPNMGLGQAALGFISMVLLAFGGLFVFWAFADSRDGPDLFTLIAGAFFLVWGVLIVASLRRYRRAHAGGGAGEPVA